MTFRIIKYILISSFVIAASTLQSQHISKLSADQRGGGAAFNLNSVPPADQITANDELVWTDSTISWQKVVNQTRDSLQVDTLIASNTAVAQSTALGAVKNRKHVGFNLKMTSAESQDEAINLPSVADVAVGTRFTFSVRDSSRNYDYYLLPEDDLQLKIVDRYAERYYFDANEVAVFVVAQSGSEKYWRLESTTSNAFSRDVVDNVINAATDFKYKRFIRGSRVRTNLGAEYEIVNVPVSAYNSNNPDSVFVYQVKDKAPWGRNLAKGSDQLHSQTYWVRPGADIQVLADFSNDPNGGNVADRLVRDGDNQLWSPIGNTIAGDKVAVSFWAKQGIAASNSNVTLSFNLAIDNTALQTINTITTSWAKYSVILTADANTTNEQVQITMNGDDFDSLDITNVLIEFGSTIKDYKRTESTTSTEGTVYAVYRPRGAVEADNVFQRKNDSKHLEQCCNYAVTQKEKTVSCIKNRTITETVDIPIGAGIIGTYQGGALGLTDYASQGTIFWLDLKNASLNAFEFPATANYEAGQSIEGVMMIPISSGRAAIKTNDGFYHRIENVSIVNYLNSTRYLSYGVDITAGSIQTEIDGCQIRQASVAGILYSGSTQFSLTNSKMMDCEVGMISAGDMYVENTWFEDLDSCAIIHDGSSSRIDWVSVYTEGVPSSGGGGTANVFYIKSANTLTSTGGLVNGEGNDNVLVRLENVKAATFIGSRFVNGSQAFETTSATGPLNLIGCTSHITWPASSFTGIYDSTLVSVLGANHSTTNTDYNNFIPRLETYDADINISKIDSSQLSQPTIHTELLLNSPTIGNRNENLVVHSERVEHTIGNWGNLGSVTFTQNDTIAPDGTTTAERITFGSGFGEWRYDAVSEALITGDWYTISFYVANSSFDEITVELGDVSANTETVTLTNSDTWIRHSVTIQHTNATSFVDFITNGSAAQYCHFWGVQIERNKYLGDYIRTAGAISTDDLINSSIIIAEGDTLEFDGDVALQSAIIDSTGSAGANGSLIASTGDGWVWQSAASVVPADDLADVSTASDNATESKYTMKSGVLVEFESSDGNTVLSLDETNERIGKGTETPTSSVDITTNNLGVTQTDASGIVLANNTAAAAGAQQISPALRFRGSGWKTDATAASQITDWRVDLLPVQGTANPTSRLQFSSSINGGAYTNRFYIVSNAAASFLDGNGLTVSNTVMGTDLSMSSASGTLNWSGRTKLRSPADGQLTLLNNAANDWSRLNFGGTTSAFPSWQRSGATLIARLADDSGNTDVLVADEAYGSSWNGSLEVPTKNAIYDKIEATKSHVELYNDKVSSIVQTVVANTPEQLHTLTTGLINSFTESNDTITYTGTTTKIFHLTCSFAWSNDTAPSVNLLYIYVNDIEIGKFYAEQAFTNADDFHEGATSGLLSLANGDQVTVYIESDTSSDIEVKHLNISLTEL